MCLGWFLVLALLLTSTPSWTAEIGGRDKTGAEVRVSSCLIPARIIKSVRPKYSPAAKEAKIEGPVVLQVIVGKNGRAKEIHTLSGHPLLAEAAERAVRQWRFRPYRILGESVASDAQVTVNLKLTPRNTTGPTTPKPAQKTGHLC